MPRYLEPMKATLATKPFRDEDWLFEVKWDGYRVEAVVRDGKVALFTRNGHDAETYFPRLLTPPTVDRGARGDRGRRGRRARRRGPARLRPAPGADRRGAGGSPVPLVFQAFDLLYLDGRSLLDVPARGAQAAARARPPADRPGPLRRRTSTPRGSRSSRRPQAQGARGDRRQAPPVPLRARPPSPRLAQDQGPAGAGARRRRLDAGGGERRRSSARSSSACTRASGCGSPARSGSGFDGADPQGAAGAPRGRSRRTHPPFDPAPPPDYKGRWGGDLAGVRWVRPELVIRAEIGGWSRDGHVRQSAFKGLEPGRDPREVVRERAVDPAKAGPRSRGDRRAGDSGRARGSGVPGPAAPPSRRPSARPMTRRGSSPTPSSTRSRRLKAEGTWQRRRPGAASSRTSTRCCSRPRDGVGRGARHQARPHRLLRADRAGDAAAPRRPSAQPAAVPQRRGRARASGRRTSRRPPRAGSPSGTRPASASARTATPTTTSSPTGRPPSAGSATRRAFEIHAWTSTLHDPWPPTFALIDIDPGADDDLGRDPRRSPASSGPRSSTSACAATPRSPAARHPGLDPRRARRYAFDETSAWVERLSRAIGATVPDLVSLGVGEGRPRRPRPPRLHPERVIKTLVAPYAVRPRPGAPVSAPIPWDELDDPDLAPDRWTIRNLAERVAAIGDPWAGLPGDEQDLPAL